MVSTATLASLLKKENWDRTEDDARRMWLLPQIETIKTVRGNNNSKSRLVHLSLGFEIFAIALLTVALGFELYTRFWTGPTQHSDASAGTPITAGDAAQFDDPKRRQLTTATAVAD